MRYNYNNVDIEIEDNIETYYHEKEKITGIVFGKYNDFSNLEFEVEDGIKNGSDKDYLNNGTIIKIQNFKNGMEDGEGREFYETGELKEEMYFEKGDLIWSNEYNEDGKLIDTYRKSEN